MGDGQVEPPGRVIHEYVAASSICEPFRASGLALLAQRIDDRGSVAWFVRLCLVVVQPLDRRLYALDVLAYALGTHVPPGVRRDSAQLVEILLQLVDARLRIP